MERIEEKMDQDIEILVERVRLRRLKAITTNLKRLFTKRRKVLRPLKIKKEATTEQAEQKQNRNDDKSQGRKKLKLPETDK